MNPDTETPTRPRFWITLAGIVIVLVFLYFYQPFEAVIATGVDGVRASNVIFWFAAAVGLIGYVIAHWQSYRQNIFRASANLEVGGLVFDTLQIAILVAVILCAGAVLQTLEMLSEHLINRGAILGPVFGGLLLTIIVLILLAIAFYLLHRAVGAFRTGWRPRQGRLRGDERRTGPSPN